MCGVIICVCVCVCVGAGGGGGGGGGGERGGRGMENDNNFVKHYVQIWYGLLQGRQKQGS